LSSISSTYSSTENDLPQSRQYKLTPLQAIRSFIFPPHFLHFMLLVYPERGLNENINSRRSNSISSIVLCSVTLFCYSGLSRILLNPSLEKRGMGRFMENRFIQKIPLNPPLPKGENAREKDSRQVPLESLFQTGQAGMITKRVHGVKGIFLCTLSL
jgi:hypothetical protein